MGGECHRHPKVLSAHQPQGAGRAIQGPPRKSGEALEGRGVRFQGPQAMDKIHVLLCRAPVTDFHGTSAVVHHSRGPQVVSGSRHREYYTGGSSIDAAPHSQAKTGSATIQALINPMWVNCNKPITSAGHLVCLACRAYDLVRASRGIDGDMDSGTADLDVGWEERIGRGNR